MCRSVPERYQTIHYVRCRNYCSCHTVNHKVSENDDDVSIEDTVQTPKIAHREGLKAIESAFDNLRRDEAHFWLNGYVNKQNCRIWSEANPQVYVETPLHSEKLTVWCALWAGGILLQK
ncbi:hypothetical protein TNCV_1755461 [Trichonephila clavipes]|nr:hypothetical protein TNCV_1755461 [Trichonephila clavipes]